MTEEFHRIRRLPPYVFAEVNRAKAKARAAGEDIIDLGMGNPDSPTPPHIVAKLVETVADPRSHRYSVSRGIPGLRRALATYYRRRFDVALDPETEIVATLGSKEGLANLASAITSPGDTILVPNPSYPIHQFGFIIAGAAVRSVPAEPGEAMLSALDRAVRHSVPKPTALVVNFPSNPTATLADLDFYRALVAFARRNDIWIMSDLAYAEIYFGDRPPPSILQVEGARDIAVEFTSMSKTYSMAGWRMGFAAGNPRLINALTRNEILPRLRRLHADPGRVRRRPHRTAGLRRAGPRHLPGAARRPDPRLVPGRVGHPQPGRIDCSRGRRSRPPTPISGRSSSASACLPVPRSPSPRVSASASTGEGHVRIGLVENTHRLRQAVRSIRLFLNDHAAEPSDEPSDAPSDAATLLEVGV